jgi:hypothetical protein
MEAKMPNEKEIDRDEIHQQDTGESEMRKTKLGRDVIDQKP